MMPTDSAYNAHSDHANTNTHNASALLNIHAQKYRLSLTGKNNTDLESQRLQQSNKLSVVDPALLVRAEQFHHLRLLGVGSGDRDRVGGLQGSGELRLVRGRGVVIVSRGVHDRLGHRNSRVGSGGVSVVARGGVSVRGLLVGILGGLGGGLALALLQHNLLARSLGDRLLLLGGNLLGPVVVIGGLQHGLVGGSVVGRLGFGGHHHGAGLDNVGLGAHFGSLRSGGLDHSSGSLAVLGGAAALDLGSVASCWKLKVKRSVSW